MTPRLRGLMVILDGVGDRPSRELDGATPLEAAHRPFLDRLAREGSTGLSDPLFPGIPVDTPTGTAMLLGVPPRSVTTMARGPVEAAGVGLELAPGDVAVRCNFATLRSGPDGLTVVDRRAGRIREGTDTLAEALSDLDLGDGIRATVRAATQHRAVARLRGGLLSHRVGSTDPGGARLPAPVRHCTARDPGDAAAERTAEAINRLVRDAHGIMATHPVNRDREARGVPPANGLITRGAGAVTRVDSMLTTMGLSAAVVAGERTVVGLARLLRFEPVIRPGFTGLPDTDVAGKVAAAREALDRVDVVFLHFKAPDILAHDLKPRAKRDFLSAVDRALAALPVDDLVVAVCGDHCTDSTTGMHSGDPVPALLRSPHGRRDTVDAYHERACGTGGLGRIPATAFLWTFLNAMGAVPEWRAGHPLPFTPG